MRVRNFLKAPMFVVMSFFMFAVACTKDEAKQAEGVQPGSETNPADLTENGKKTFEPGKVLFAFDRSDVSADYKTVVEYVAERMKANQEMKVLVEGHCDARGTDEYNMALGEHRANNVRDFLTNLGVNAERVETVSYGKNKPVVEGHSEEAYQQNRRAEFKQR